MLVEKEIIGPGVYWYLDQETSLPRKLEVTPDLTKYWHEQGGKMLSAGLTVPVPFEHDFDVHPMTPKDKLLNNAGWVKEFRLHDGKGGKGDKLFGIVEVLDDDVAKRLPRTIRWTSPWINSFTDGHGTKWNNVISHLALTTRPRITQQAPFPSVAAAMSLANTVTAEDASATAGGFCLTRAGRLVTRKKDKKLRPQYPIAFSLMSGGVKFAGLDDMEAMDDDGQFEDEYEEGDEDDEDDNIDLPPLGDPVGDVKMEELLCDLLTALGVEMPEGVGEAEFKRALYEATMTKVKELSSKGMRAGETGAQSAQPNTTSPAGGAGQNPLIQQEQQPMFMSLDDINKLQEPMRGLALSMRAENERLRGEVMANAAVANGLRDAKLKEASAHRTARVAILARMSPRAKADLESMLALPSMALSMGEGGAVVDPMAQTLVVLEKSLADMPRLLTTDVSALSVQAQPTDGEMSAEESDRLADSFARSMGAPPERKTA